MLTQPFAGKNPTNPNCVGENLTPALSWVRAPAGTRSFAIVMDDQAGSGGLDVNHWMAYLGPYPPRGLIKAELMEEPKGKTLGAASLVLRYAN